MITLEKTPYKGTRDFYPEDLRVRKYIFDKWSEVAESFGYQEYATPLLEPLSVYSAKSGDELVNEQTYAFDDRGGRRVAIRPEMTPSISRLVAQRRQELAYPARLYSIANFMRYERTQRGREREFWQLNIDTFGDDSLQIEAETIYLAEKLVKNFGATPEMFEIRLNDRRLIDFVMKDYLGLNDQQTSMLVKLLDRIKKTTPKEFEEQARAILAKQATEKLPKLTELINAQSLDQIPQEIRESTPFKNLANLIVLLEELGVETAVFDITLMRGLDYYTGTVFEVYDLNPENNRAMFGGGRYDGLVGLFGVEPIGATGFAIGLTTTELFLRSWNLIPDLQPETDIYLALQDQNYYQEAFQLAEKLRAEGKNVDLDSRDVKLDKKFKSAEKKGIKEMIIFGEKEAKSGEYEIKSLSPTKNQP